jgi:hypothetical protein
MIRQLKWAAFLLAAMALAIAPPSLATADENENTSIMVLGDSLGDGMYVGLYRSLRETPNITVFRLSEIGTGLFNIDMDAWEKKIRRVVETKGPEAVVVMLGGNDPQPIRLPGRERYAFKTEDWRTHYTARVDRYTRFLKDLGLAVFWVGLPSMRDAGYDEDIQYLNELFRRQAEINKVTFIPTRDLTVDESGGYCAYGMSVDGRRTLLRTNDGKHFTGPGYEILAERVLTAIGTELKSFETVLRRD